MNKQQKIISPLAEAELEVLAEGREWMRKRLEKKIKRLAEKESAISPLTQQPLKKNKKA